MLNNESNNDPNTEFNPESVQDSDSENQLLEAMEREEQTTTAAESSTNGSSISSVQNLNSENAVRNQHPTETKDNKKQPRFMPTGPQTANEKALYDKAVFTWTAPEYIQHPKSKTWYLAAAIAAGLMILFDIFTANFTMALAVVVLATVYLYVHTHHPPKEIKITISRMGVKVGHMIFPFSSIQAFWIIYNPPHVSTLNLRVKEHFFSDIIIQLNNEDPAPIREYLCGQIPEWEGKTERFSDIILRLLKL